MFVKYFIFRADKLMSSPVEIGKYSLNKKCSAFERRSKFVPVPVSVGRSEAVRAGSHNSFVHFETKNFLRSLDAFKNKSVQVKCL